MLDRRSETRLLCADLVEIHWREKSGKNRKGIANLEDISLSGACLQTDFPIPKEVRVRIVYPQGNLNGTVKYCVYREIGYFLGIEFAPDVRWSLQKYKPQHLLDPRRLVIRALKETRQRPSARIH